MIIYVVQSSKDVDRLQADPSIGDVRRASLKYLAKERNVSAPRITMGVWRTKSTPRVSRSC